MENFIEQGAFVFAGIFIGFLLGFMFRSTIDKNNNK